MEFLQKSFYHIFIVVTLAGIITVSANAETNDTTVITASSETEMDKESTTTMMTSDEASAMTTTSGQAETVNQTSPNRGENTTTTEPNGNNEEVTEINVTDIATQMTTKGEPTTEGGFPVAESIATDVATRMTTKDKPTTTRTTETKQCYQCMYEANSNEDDICIGEQIDVSKAAECDGNCWITAYYGESDDLVNISRSCVEDACSDMNKEGFDCKEVETDNTFKMCTYCCSTDKCNDMSDGSNLRCEGFMLMAAIISYGIFFYEFL